MARVSAFPAARFGKQPLDFHCDGGDMSPESTDPENLHDPRVLRQDIEDLKRQHEVTEATQAGVQATQAATQAGAEATQAAVQAGQATTFAASQAGLTATVAAGAAALVIGIFLGIAISKS